jgi:hypothetical protein
MEGLQEKSKYFSSPHIGWIDLIFFLIRYNLIE